MGYSIYIGNAVVETCEGGRHTRYVVEGATHEKAPRWPVYLRPDGKPDFTRGVDISGDTNGRHPSYSSMSNWAQTVGLYDLFLGDGCTGGLLNPHPGCQFLTSETLTQICTARIRWQEAHTVAEPGWRNGEDSTLAKLLWYEWWTKWALESCKTPAIQNI